MLYYKKSLHASRQLLQFSILGITFYIKTKDTNEN